MKNKIVSVIILAGILILCACKDDGTNNNSNGIFSNQTKTKVKVNGVMGSNTPNNWDSYLAAYPDTKM